MSELNLPPIVFGTSGLGNLYVALPEDVKQAVVAACLAHGPRPVFFDSAGKYGAGLALESLGKCLTALHIPSADVMISNKLGWFRTELKTPEPTFEPGVWKSLEHDAVQLISYEGILACYEQGNQLLGNYKAEFVSVHDPDEYLAAAISAEDKVQRHQDILDAYRALHDLKTAGKVKAIGIGAKDWRIIKKISSAIRLDWVMIANSMTIHSHPPYVVDFMKQLQQQGTAIINSAVFNGGFLTGQDYYNYQPVSLQSHPLLYQWRERFYRICADHNVSPAAICMLFGRQAPGVNSIAISTTNPKRIRENIELLNIPVSNSFWQSLVEHKLVDAGYVSDNLYHN
jgi:D-threo-aldose 1-dehydrogenase